MKRVFITCAALAALGSCNKITEVSAPVGQESETRTIDVTATVSMSGDSDEMTRVSSDFGDSYWKFSWENDDKVYYLSPKTTQGAVGSSELAMSGSANGDKATFTGTATIDGTPQWYSLLHSEEACSEKDGVPFFNLTEQDGTLSDTHMISQQEEYENTTVQAVNPTLKHVGAFLKLKINYGEVPSTWSGVTLSSVIIKGVTSTAKLKADPTKITFNWDKPIYSGENTVGFLDIGSEVSSDPKVEGCDVITVTPDMGNIAIANGTLDLMVNVLPTDLKDSDSGIMVTLIFSNGSTYIYKKATTDANDIERAKFYALTDPSSDCITVDHSDKSKWLKPFADDNNYTPTPDATTNYDISSVEQLKVLSMLSDMGAFVIDENDTFTLTSDLDLSTETEDWEPLCKAGFNGTFDGGSDNGHSITGLTIDTPVDEANSKFDHRALFAQNNVNGTIKNVELVDCEIVGREYPAGVVSLNKGKVESCSVSGTITGESDDIHNAKHGEVGGIVAINNATGTVKDCTSTATIAGGLKEVGGIVGVNKGGKIENCTAGDGTDGSVTGELQVGGIVGLNKDNGTVTDCTSKVAVTGNSNYTGGIVGDNQSGTISNSTSSGAVTGSGNYTGGIAGNNDGTITGCESSSVVTANTSSGDYVAGIAGKNTATVSDCNVTAGSVTGHNNVGGVVGQSSGDDSKVENCSSAAAVDGNMNVGGAVGIVGPSNGSSVSGLVNNCSNTGAVTGTKHVGGVVGHVSGVVKFAKNSGAVTGKSSSSLIGGIAGYINIGYCLNSENKFEGKVTGTEKIGGVIGACDRGSYIAGCRNFAIIESLDGRTGGIVGHNDNGWVYSCYNTGEVSATVDADNYVGSIIGYHTGKANTNFYLERTPALEGIGRDNAPAEAVTTDNGAVGRNQLSLQNDATTTTDLNNAIDAFNSAIETKENAEEWKDGSDTAYPTVPYPAVG